MSITLFKFKMPLTKFLVFFILFNTFNFLYTNDSVIILTSVILYFINVFRL